MTLPQSLLNSTLVKNQISSAAAHHAEKRDLRPSSAGLGQPVLPLKISGGDELASRARLHAMVTTLMTPERCQANTNCCNFDMASNCPKLHSEKTDSAPYASAG